jgi:hypothetical protein
MNTQPSSRRELAFTPKEALWFVRMETVPEEGEQTKERGLAPMESAAEVSQAWQEVWTKLVHQEGGV